MPQLYSNKNTQVTHKQQNNSKNNISSNTTIYPSVSSVYFGTNILTKATPKEVVLGVINSVKKEIEANNPKDIKNLAKKLAELNDELPYIPDTKSNLYNEFGKMFTEKHIQPIASLLDDNSAQVRKDAIDALSIMQAESRINKIVEKFKDEDDSVRESAVWAMGRIGGGKYLENLRPMLFSDKHINKHMAINALTDHGSEGHRSLIKSCLSSRDITMVRAAAIRFFTWHGSKEDCGIVDILAFDGSMRLFGDARFAKSQILERANKK